MGFAFFSARYLLFSCIMSAIPVFIIAYNNLTFVKNFVKQVYPYTQHIVIIDNCSTYIEQHKWYDSLQDPKIRILKLAENYGHSVIDKYGDQLGVPPVFVLSDPDLELNPKMPLDAIDRLHALSIKYQRHRIGLALNIADYEQFLEVDAKLIHDNEVPYWQNKIPDDSYELYVASTDTTFALHNRTFQDRWYDNIRIAGDFTCKHLPWYRDYIRNNVPKEELIEYYKNNISSSIAKKYNLDFFLPSV